MENIANKISRLCLSVLILIALAIWPQGCKEKVIIYLPLTDKVELIAPPNTDLIYAGAPALIWHLLDNAAQYQVQMAADNIFSELMADTLMTDTSYTYHNELPNGQVYWRVRAQGSNSIWGDWSDASVRSFIINGNSDYIELAAVVQTPGTAQDLVVQDGIAYVADGQKLLTLIDIGNPANPSMIGNLDRQENDFARNVWKRPGDDLAYLAAGDGKFMAMDIRLPLDPNSIRSRSLGFAQNLYDLTGMIYQDSLYLFGVSTGYNSRRVYFHQIIFESGIPLINENYRFVSLDIADDVQGIDFDSLIVTVEYHQIDTLAGIDSTYCEQQSGMFLFIAATESGLGWIDISRSHTFDGADTLILRYPRFLGWGDTPSWALRVDIQNGFAYVADDRGGLEIFDLPDTIPAVDNNINWYAEPALIAEINTSGRTKDVQAVGHFCFLADGSGGLKIIDISNPYAPFLLAAYDTPYAYGVWADSNNIYLADRDNGIMIFDNKLF